MPNTLVLIHGYSDKGKSFAKWREHLAQDYANTEQICICDYESLTNEVTIKDLAEGFDLALKTKAGLKEDEDFDAIVHSTGMLVIRSWLTTYPKRRSRLKHLIGIAPATFGSPLARKGRSWIGAVFKGNRDLGPDFLESGDLILDNLELASPFTWNLAEKDLLDKEIQFYGTTAGTPYVHIFCGTEEYGGLRKVVSTPGTDGTVRLAGAGFNVRKIVLDLTKNQSILVPMGGSPRKRWRIDEWQNADIPVHLVDGLNHGTIITEPTDELIGLVRAALKVDNAPSFKAWLKAADAGKRIKSAQAQWQQFIVRAYDERQDPITDYNLQLFTAKTSDIDKRVGAFDKNVDVYSRDSSLRSFLVDLAQVPTNEGLWLSVMASSGSDYVNYNGHESEPDATRGQVTSRRKPDAWLDLSGFMKPGDGFLSPYTTTLVELYLDREPTDRLVRLR